MRMSLLQYISQMRMCGYDRVNDPQEKEHGGQLRELTGTNRSPFLDKSDE